MTIPTAVITGGSRGIGLACGQLFAQSGYRVVLAGRDEERLDKALKTLQVPGHQHDSISLTNSPIHPMQHMAIRCDIRSDREVQQLGKKVVSMGSVDVVINSAGIALDGLCARLLMDDVQSMLDTNLMGTMRVCKAFVPTMMRQRSGCIINLASAVGEQGSTGQCAYSATKAGVVGLTKSLAKELAPRKIRVNAIAPGFIQTDMTQDAMNKRGDTLLNDIPLGRFGTPQDVADAALYLAKANPVIDGGLIIR
ncbi:short-chain dehydrogenase/reductase SDR [Syncephalis plumigaleata]|nr:short-chain dehydrogenase/reductase SDR [Syncephalis plumigaleata]